MQAPSHHDERRNSLRTAACVVLTSLVLATVGHAQEPRSVPAEFVRFISPPGETDHFLHPAAIHVDRNHSEILVADAGHNRVIIFDTDGHYRFEFALGERVAMPVDLAVDSRGFIYVVGSTRDGRRLFRFDFDGVYLGEVDLPTAVDDVKIDGRDRLVLVDRRELLVTICAGDGTLVRSFDLAPFAQGLARHEVVLGRIEVVGDRIYVPFSSIGSVQVFTTDGERGASFGYKGNNPGELNFPVAVTEAEGIIAVLDKHRFNVVCYDEGGRFLGEFGGKGVNPGWFYHPTLLGVGPDHQVYVGQVFENKVQICRIPDFIVRHRRADQAVDPSIQGS